MFRSGFKYSKLLFMPTVNYYSCTALPIIHTVLKNHTCNMYKMYKKNHLPYGIRTRKYCNLFREIPLGINPLTRVILAIT